VVTCYVSLLRCITIHNGAQIQTIYFPLQYNLNTSLTGVMLIAVQD